MNPAAVESGPRYAATLQLLRAAETVWEGSRRFFARWDLSPSQFNILNVLRDHPDGWSQIDLSRQLIMHRSNVTGLIDRLEVRGLVQRQETPQDRRAYRVVLTAAGIKTIQDILPHYYQATEKIWADLSLAQVRQVTAALVKVSTTAERIAAQANPQ
jgi:DNA-binding MarR family transcriptional regulator